MLHRIKALEFVCGLLAVVLFGSAQAEPVSTKDTPPPDVTIALINGRPLPYSELTATVQPKLEKLQREHDRQVRELELGTARARAEFQEAELQRLIDQRVLQLEAAKRKQSAETLLSRVSSPPPTDLQVHAFYESQRSQIQQPYEAAEPQIRKLLQRQEAEEAQLHYLQTLRTKYKASMQWEPLREPVADSGPQRGPSDAIVTIVEFSDFQCPFCGRMAPVFREVLKQYPAQVRLVFRNMPLTSLHPNAAKAAEAGVCAKMQGKFWEMHDLLYAEQDSLSLDALRDKARRVGLDTAQFNECLDGGAGRTAVATDTQAGEDLGLTTTPSTFVNGRFVGGTMPLFKWKMLIEDEIHRGAAGVNGSSLSTTTAAGE